VEVLTIIIFALILLVGIAVLICWLAATSFGRTALYNSPLRRNAMAFYTPLVPFGIWIFLSVLAGGILGKMKNRLADWQQELLVLVLMGVVATVMVGMTVVIVRRYFVRGFKGFGLTLKTIGNDCVGAITTLLAVWPLMLGMLLLTVGIGKLVFGPDFEITKHEELESLTKYPQWSIRLAVLFAAIVVAPLSEELLFRGLFQTGFRNLCQKPWVAIIAASVIFAMAHPNREHWPALFVLAIGLGYAYEKSGSLFQSIFMHAMFNGTMIAATLLQQ
jgi:membrane protease YdiL (CAAX protease family)